MTKRQIWLNLGGLGLLIALLGLVYWQHTGERAVPGLMEDLQSEDRQAQQLAALHLKDIGLAAKPAVPLLVELATADGKSRLHSEAAGALPTIDLRAARQVMAAWLPKLHDQDPQVRREAASVLGAIGPVAKPATPSLLATLHDPNVNVRGHVVRALGAIGLPTDKVIQGLLAALRDPDWTVRHASVTQFSFSGFSSPESLTLLHELTNDANQTVAQSAKSAVASADRPIPISIQLLTLDQPMDRTYPLLQLAKLGPRAAEAAPKLAALLSAEKPLERYLAACALESIGPAAKGSLHLLEQAAHDSDPIVREAIAEARLSIAGETRATP